MAAAAGEARALPALLSRLQRSEEARSRQGAVVRQLQAKVRKDWTGSRELEQQLEAVGESLPGPWEATEGQSVEKVLLQQRCETLAEENALLREHLDRANEINWALKEDVGKLTADWMRARDELELKESEWRSDRELHDSYLRGEQSHLLSLWHQVVTFHRQFLEVKTATDRDLSELKAEQMRLSDSLLVNCTTWAQQQETTREAMCLRATGDLEKELQDRVMELSDLLVQSQRQKEEKTTFRTLNDTVGVLIGFTFILKDLAALEENHSILQRELVAARESLEESQDSISVLQHQHREQEEKCGKLQQRLEQLEEECSMSSSHQQHLQCLVEALRSDCANLEKTWEELQQQLEVAEQEASRLRQRNTELQLKEDSAQGEKEEQQEMLERARREEELLLQEVASLEEKHCLLQRELVAARETVWESQLQRDLLKEEKAELSTTLEKAEQSVAELIAKLSEQEELELCERRNEELCTEKAHLEQLLKKAEEQEEGLRVQLAILAVEEESQEELREVYRQQESARSGLEQLCQESSRQGHALATLCEEKEELVCEKAVLEVRLAAMEQDRQGLSEQLAEARSVRGSLESSLFEAQQHSSQLEIARSQLEAQLDAVTQAKEVIQGEAKCLQCELETERWRVEQERAELAQQLLRTQQQCDRTLRLWETAHQGEIKKLLQDLASEREGHHSELQEMLEQWRKEKAETEGEHEKQLLAMKQKVAAMQAQQEEEGDRVENAKQEVLREKEHEKNALLEMLLQSQEELREACQQLEQLRQEVKEQRENGQRERDRLQALNEELPGEIKLLQESVTASESQANAAADVNQCLEQELQSTLSVLKIKNEELETQREKIQMLQREAAEAKALQENLTPMTAILSEREGEMKLYQEQLRALENQKEMHQTTLARIVKDTTEKNQKIESQQEEIRELEKQLELQRTAVSKMSRELEERDQEMRSQQEEMQELEKQLELQRTAVSKMSRELEQRNMFELCEESMRVALTPCQKQVGALEEVLRKRDEDIETLVQKLQRQEEELKTLQSLQLRLTEESEEVRQEKVLEEALPEREAETKAQGEQEESEEELKGLWEELKGLQHVQQALREKDEEIKCQRDRVGCLEETLRGKERELRRQSKLLKQITSALRWKDDRETLGTQIQRLQTWEEEEAEKRRVLQERDRLLQRQEELTQQLEDERKAKGEELERVVATLKQRESGEMAWKEKAQALTLALANSGMANGTLREEMAILQSLVAERDTERFHQQAVAEGEQLPRLSEQRLLSQQLEGLQGAVARLELEKVELKQYNAELRRTLGQVERERRRLRRYCRGLSCSDVCGFSKLQNQVSLLQAQLAQEQKSKQDYIECCAKTTQELSDLHQELSSSLAAVVREPRAAVLEAEAQKLDWCLHLYVAPMSLDHQSPERQPLHPPARSA
ncbi:LOW QUALITY PROTEIN: uncharacterized protein AAHN32_013785 [Aegotheles albertisi]